MVSAAPDVNDMHRSGKLPPDPFTGAEPINDREPSGVHLPPKQIEWIGAGGIFCEHPEPDWIIPDVCMGPGRADCIAGYAGGGKTAIAQAVALACASGNRAFGWYRTRHCKVRHIDRDQGRGTLRRYWRLARGMGLERGEIEGRLEVSLFPDLNLVSSTDDEWLRICDGWDLLIVDSLRTMLPGIDENDSQVQDRLLRFANFSTITGTSFLLLHHFGKGQGEKASLESLRGSSGIGAGLGSVLTVTGTANEPRLVQHVKADGDASRPLVEPFYLVLEEVHDGIEPCGWRLVLKSKEQIDPPSSPMVKLSDVARQVIEVLRANPGASTKMVRGLVRGADNSLVPAALELLERRGQAASAPRRGRGGGVSWSLVEGADE